MSRIDDVHRIIGVMVPMRDGTRLATDVYLPTTEGDASWPVILTRTPYDRKATNLIKLARKWALHGYAVVIQDVRGRYDSEGAFEPFVNEADDGYDCIEWVGQQPWCDGKVGTFGTSYLAMTQSSMATTNPPYLASMFVSQGNANFHQTRSRRGGAFEFHRINWILKMAESSKEAAADPVLRRSIADMHANLEDWIRDGYPIREGLTPLAQLPTYERALLNFMTRGDYDEFWQNPGLNISAHYDTFKDVPVTWLGSWYDAFPMETTQNYLAMKERKTSPQRLILGPWIHGMSEEEVSFSGDIDFGEDAIFDSFEQRLAWFDATLKGVDNGALDTAPVRLFVMGGGSGSRTEEGRMDHGGVWRDEQEWPLERTVYTPYYFHGDGKLSAEAPEASDSSTTYDFDPRDPVPTISARKKSMYERGGGGFHQRQHPDMQWASNHLPLSARKDVIVFQTPVLDHDVEVTGPIEVVLYVSSSAVDTDFTAKLIDQYPPNKDYPEGYALELTSSIRRCRYRNGFEKQELMTPGEVYELRFPLPPTSNLFKAGHRIRVDVSSSNWPKYEVNPNTGEPLGRHRRFAIATNTLHHDSKRPSHVVLPVIPQ